MEQVTDLNFLDNEGRGYPFLSAQCARVEKDVERQPFASIKQAAIYLGWTQTQVDVNMPLHL